MHRKITILSLLLCSFFLQFCKKNDDTTQASVLNLPATPYNYSNISFPAHIANDLILNDNTPANNQITDAGATLGRVLFYDKNLSSNKTISCASCHKQANGFTDNDVFSRGFDGGLTTRHSMNTLNVRFYRSGKMFWDERASTLELQVLMPIQNHVEMGLTLSELVSRVQNLSYYPALFTSAFGSATIDTTKISKALAQFVRSIVTYQSKYDKVKQGLASFTAAEAQGENVFLNAQPPAGGLKCSSCHTPPMFMNSEAPPFGLPDPNDLGINNSGHFKVGSLRNIGLASSLFHNGSIANVATMLNAGPPPAGVPAHGIPPQDRANVLAFLNTLTDSTVLTDVRFSSPFR